MKDGSNTKTALLAIFIALAAMAGNKEMPAMGKETVQAFVQDINGGQLHLRLYPGRAGDAEQYSLQVRIITKLPLQPQNAIYMNYQLKNAFHLINGADTLPLDCSARIPGISNTEFVYLASIRLGLTDKAGGPLGFFMNDTVAGLGRAHIMLKTLHN
jgi:hypothetical protein